MYLLVQALIDSPWCEWLRVPATSFKSFHLCLLRVLDARVRRLVAARLLFLWPHLCRTALQPSVAVCTISHMRSCYMHTRDCMCVCVCTRDGFQYWHIRRNPFLAKPNDTFSFVWAICRLRTVCVRVRVRIPFATHLLFLLLFFFFVIFSLQLFIYSTYFSNWNSSCFLKCHKRTTASTENLET